MDLEMRLPVAYMVSDALLASQPVQTWLIVLEEKFAAHKKTGWDFILHLRDGIATFGANDAEKMALYEAAADQLDVSVHTLQNYVSAARKPIQSMVQELGLEIGHLVAVQGLDHDVAQDIVQLAAERRMSVSLLRKHVFAYNSPPIAPAVPDVGNWTTIEDAEQWPDPHDDDAPPLAQGYLFPCPSDPVQAATVLLRQFDASQIDTLIASLMKGSDL